MVIARKRILERYAPKLSSIRTMRAAADAR